MPIDGSSFAYSFDDKPGVSGTVILIVDGKEVGKATLNPSVPLAFTACETFDVGSGLVSPVSHKIC